MGLSTVVPGNTENGILSLRETIIATGTLQILAGIFWILFATPSEKRMLNELV